MLTLPSLSVPFMGTTFAAWPAVVLHVLALVAVLGAGIVVAAVLRASRRPAEAPVVIRSRPRALTMSEAA